MDQRDEIAKHIMANWAKLPQADPSQIDDRSFLTTGIFPEDTLPDGGMTPALNASYNRWINETNARIPVTDLGEQAGLRDIRGPEIRGPEVKVISGPALKDLMNQQMNQQRRKK
jgi:hypothetical protein